MFLGLSLRKNYLGIILNSELCVPLLNGVKGKINIWINKCKFIIKATWGIKSKITMILHNNRVVERMILYGYEVWYRNTNVKLNSKPPQFRVVVLVCAIKFYRIAGTDSICVVSGCPPLQLQVRCNLLSLKEKQSR